MNHNILIADDETGVLNALNRVLSRSGFSVFLVNNGDDLLKVMETTEFAVVICDYRMRGLSGTEALKIVRERHPKTVRILISGFTDAAMLIDAINKGHVSRIITKPWDDSVLLDAVKESSALYNVERENEILAADNLKKAKELEILNKQLMKSVDETRDALDHVSSLNEQLAELNEHSQYLLSTLSHEIRGPVGSIISIIDLLSEDSGNSEDYYPIITNIGFHIVGIIEDILDYSNLASGNFKLKRKSCAIADTLGFIQKLCQVEADKKNVLIKTDVDSLIGKTNWDHTKIRQILINLVINAVKFSPINGVISVDAVFGTEGISLSVTDEGPGIPEEKRKCIFEPFKQLDDEASTRLKGYGLGMYITKRFVELHNGTIGIEEAEGGGCKFIIELPE